MQYMTRRLPYFRELLYPEDGAMVEVRWQGLIGGCRHATFVLARSVNLGSCASDRVCHLPLVGLPQAIPDGCFSCLPQVHCLYLGRSQVSVSQPLHEHHR